MKRKEFSFIDLFAGLGGFHFALEKLGGHCVFASELREDLRTLYSINHPDTPVIVGDITKKESLAKIPPHDVLCAGFPCQPFSQAGKRQGFNDEKDRGNLFNYICDIAKKHRPEVIFLENVANLKNHDNGNTWKVIYHRLHDELHYDVREEILSPHQYGYPQHRKRIYIVCRLTKKGGLNDFSFPPPRKCKCKIMSIIDERDTNVIPIKGETRNQINVWQNFLTQLVNHGESIPRFPIWAMEFGADYEYENSAPFLQDLDALRRSRGTFGRRVVGDTVDMCLSQLPVYARTKVSPRFPSWKIRYIRENRDLYERNREWIDQWLDSVRFFENSHLKFEWNCGPDAEPTINNKIVQFRASGIRVKNLDYSPALNLVGTQIPIFPWIKIGKQNGRYMSCKEASKIQGMEKIRWGNDSFELTKNRRFEALGNAVNVNVVRSIFQKVIELYGQD